MSQFSDRPFAIGSMFGIRSFRINGGGELTGVVHRRTWQPDVNEAICDGGDPIQSFAAAMQAIGVSAGEAAWNLGQMVAAMNGTVSLRKRPAPPPPPTLKTREPHPIGSLDCHCGFYAYFHHAHNPHHVAGNILGIIEGFGVMTVGSRGFRCSKARIRALIVEDFEQGFALAKVMPNYPGIPVFPSVDAALVEFPLTVPDGTPDPGPNVTTSTKSVTLTMTLDTSGWSRAFARVARQFGRQPAVTVETPQERALRLRRERNTGPQSRVGLDGRFRRHAQS